MSSAATEGIDADAVSEVEDVASSMGDYELPTSRAGYDLESAWSFESVTSADRHPPQLFRPTGARAAVGVGGGQSNLWGSGRVQLGAT